MFVEHAVKVQHFTDLTHLAVVVCCLGVQCESQDAWG